MKIHEKETKLCFSLVFGWFLSECKGVRLRLADTGGLNISQEAQDHTIEVLHSAQFIFGIVSLSLLFVSFVLSFLFVGNVCERNKALRIRIFSVKISQDANATEDTNMPEGLTAVMKMNNETAKNFILPIEMETQQTTTPACIFELDYSKVDQMSFSIIIRDGNIPIHFETVRAGQFVKGSSSVQGKENELPVLEFSTFHENETKLQNKRVLLYYDIESK